MTPLFATRIAARAIGSIQLVLGGILWTGRADWLAGIHIVVGLLLVIDLWVAVVLGLRAGAPVALAGLAILWSIGMPILGLVQAGLVPGPWHVVIQVVHLIVGFAAVGIVEAIGGRSEARTARA